MALIISIIIIIGVIFISMTIHELMHGLTAYWLGDDTAKRDGRLTLNPIKHIDPFLTILLPVLLIISNGIGINAPIFGGAKPVPFNPNRVKGGDWGAALVGLMGPLTNLVIAFICYVIFTLLPIQSASVVGNILTVAVSVNLGFFAFNILPIPPLDGSRLLYAVAPEAVQRFMSKLEQYGLIIVFAIVLLASPFISRLIFLINQLVLAGFDAILHVL